MQGTAGLGKAMAFALFFKFFRHFLAHVNFREGGPILLSLI